MKEYSPALSLIFLAVGLIVGAYFIIPRITSNSSNQAGIVQSDDQVLGSLEVSPIPTSEPTSISNPTPEHETITPVATVTPQTLDDGELSNDPPEMFIDTATDYFVLLKTTEGEIEIDLFEKETPITVNNFIYLVSENFYNGTIFHRVIEEFMIQGGDPTGTGRGGPPYRFDDELPITRDYVRGTLAMANSGPDTNGSQFFIMHGDYDLPKNYVIFGQVVNGIDVVDKIATAVVEASEMGENSKPINPVMVEIIVK